MEIIKTVLVTGATGFIAGWIIVKLLNKNYMVKASIRNLDKVKQVLAEIGSEVAANKISNLTFFKADLTSSKDWIEPMKNIDAVIHTASPLGNGTETAAQLTEVAKGGTLNILNAMKTNNIKKMVFTSSLAASTPQTKVGAIVITESFWTDLKNRQLDPYRISKVAAEMAAWDFAQKNNINLTTILPGAVFGPALSKNNIGTTKIIKSLMEGNSYANVPLEICDVRDIADLHILALEKEVANNKRYLAASQGVSLVQIAKILKEHFPKLKIKTKPISNFVLRVFSWFNPQLRTFVPMLKRKWHHSTQLAQNELNWKQYTIKKIIIDTAKALLSFNLVE